MERGKYQGTFNPNFKHNGGWRLGAPKPGSISDSLLDCAEGDSLCLRRQKEKKQDLDQRVQLARHHAPKVLERVRAPRLLLSASSDRAQIVSGLFLVTRTAAWPLRPRRRGPSSSLVSSPCTARHRWHRN